jgi:hypothetical protein
MLLLGLFTLGVPAVWAKSKHTSFKDVIARSETIVIAKVKKAPKYGSSRTQLDVLEVLKGKLKPGKHEVRFADLPHGGRDEFIAFLDKDRIWRFTAAPLNAKKVKQAVLGISGFNDYNAHWVSPGLLTWQQLQAYLQDGSLRYKFRGPIYFPQPGKSSWKAGSLRLRGSYDAVRESAHVQGLPGLKGLPAEPEVFFHYDRTDGGRIDLEYSCDRNRPLHLFGRVVGLDPKSNEIRARFAVSAPEVLLQKTLEAYLADARLGPCSYTFRLRCAPAKKQGKPFFLTLALGKESGVIGSVAGWGPGPLEIGSTSYSGPTRRSGSASIDLPKKVARDLSAEDWVLRMVAPTGRKDFLILAFDLGPPKQSKDRFHWPFQNELLYTLYSNPVRGTLQLHDGQKLRTVTTFTVTLDTVRFVPNEDAKK